LADGGGREVVEPWNLSWDTSRAEMSVSRKLTLNRTNLAQVAQSGSAHARAPRAGVTSWSPPGGESCWEQVSGRGSSLWKKPSTTEYLTAGYLL